MFIAVESVHEKGFSFTGSPGSFAVALDLVNHDVILWYMDPVEVKSIFSFSFLFSFLPCASPSLISAMFCRVKSIVREGEEEAGKKKENTYSRKVYPIDRLHHLLNSPVTPVALCVKWTDFNMRSECFCSFTSLLGVHFLSLFFPYLQSFSIHCCSLLFLESNAPFVSSYTTSPLSLTRYLHWSKHKQVYTQ